MRESSADEWDPATTDDLWGGQVEDFQFDVTSQRVEMRVKVGDAESAALYRLVFERVSELGFTNATRAEWAYADLTEIHVREDVDRPVVVDIVLWSEPTGLHIVCEAWSLERLSTAPRRLVRLGYWRSDEQPAWADPESLVAVRWFEEPSHVVTDYLRRGFVARAYLGTSTCRLCGDDVGSLELSDGVYIWPEGLAHYVDVHGVRLPPRFTRHIHQIMTELEGAEVDEAWWRSVADERWRGV